MSTIVPHIPAMITPYVATIPVGNWNGSGNDWYIEVSASNVTENSILIPHYDAESNDNLNGTVWCEPGDGVFSIHTNAIPSGTVTVLVQFAGTMGEAQYQVLADVYSKSEADALYGDKVNYDDVVNSLTIDDTTGIKVAGQHEVYELNLVSTSTCFTNSYTSHNTVDFNKLTKRNGFVHIQLHIIFDSGSEATSAAFANVPIGYRPSSQTRIPMIIKKSNASIVYSGLIETDGYIKQSLTASGVQEVWIDTIYQL